MKPSVGRIVHYVSGQVVPDCRAAVVTEVSQIEVNEQNPAGDGVFREALGLCVINPGGQFFVQGIVQDEEGKSAGTWHWPERVE